MICNTEFNTKLITIGFNIIGFLIGYFVALISHYFWCANKFKEAKE